MPRAKRERQERSDKWEVIQQWCRFPEQRLYESIRPVTRNANDPSRTSARNRDGTTDVASCPISPPGCGFFLSMPAWASLAWDWPQSCSSASVTYCIELRARNWLFI